MHKFIVRYRKWRNWKQYSHFNWFQKLLVLFGLKKSQHFDEWRY